MAKFGWKVITTLIWGISLSYRHRTKGEPATLLDSQEDSSPSLGSRQAHLALQTKPYELESPQD